MNYPNVQLFIDGKWRPAASGRTIPVLNPATEENVGTVAHADKSDLDEAAAAAEKGFKVWRAISSYERSKVMRKAADLMRERAEMIATLMTMEQGKIFAEARIETMASADIIEWFAEEGRRTYGRMIPARVPGVYQMAIKDPVGVVAAFTPWNFPINQVVKKLAAALAAGCDRQGAGGDPRLSRRADPGLCRCRRAGRRDQPGLRRACRDFGIPDPASDHPQDLLHRLDQGRQGSRGDGGPAHEARHHGARRPRPRDRVRRRRCRIGRQDHGRREISQ